MFYGDTNKPTWPKQPLATNKNPPGSITITGVFQVILQNYISEDSMIVSQ